MMVTSCDPRTPAAVRWTPVGTGRTVVTEGQSDLARIRRDHEFLRVLATAVAKQGLGNPITDLNLINSVKSDLTFDQGWPVGDMVSLVRTFHSMNIGSVPQLTL